jgi:hypothetical protein
MVTKSDVDAYWQKREHTWAGALLLSAQEKKFYGTITIEMRDGRIIRALKSESLKPPIAIKPGKDEGTGSLTGRNNTGGP